MEFNILLAGVGGQGILTIAHAISRVAMRHGCHVKQSEVHGMSQRGGAVQAHLRFADHPVHSDLIPLGQADMIVSVEPLEVLRYTEYLSDRGIIVSSSVPFSNIKDYPPIDNVHERIARFGDHVLLDAQRLAKVAGSVRSENMVMLGAAARFLDFSLDEFAELAAETFAAKGERVVEINRRALHMGFRAADVFRDCMQRGQTSRAIRRWMDSLTPDQLAGFAGKDVADILRGPMSADIGADVLEQIRNVLANARAAGRRAPQSSNSALLEHEVYRIVELAGAVTPPRHRFIPKAEVVSEDTLAAFPGDRIALKIVSPEIVHKSDAGGIAFVSKDIETVQREIERLIREQSALAKTIDGVLLVEFVEQAYRGLGSELFVGIRQTREFGPVIAAGLGGVDTEYLAAKMRPGIAVAKASAVDTSPEAFFELFQQTAAYELLAGRVRGHERVVGDGDLLRCFRAFITIARRFCVDGCDGACLEELEVNPFAFRRRQIVPLDGRGRLGEPVRAPRPRPLEHAARLLEPGSIAVVGVSGKRANFGRIILNNIQDCGFPQEHLYVIKDGEASIDGVRCVSTLDQLPERVDLLVAATSAPQVPELVDRVLSGSAPRGACSSVILIPGGLGEKEGTQSIQVGLREAIDKARSGREGAPIFLGGNCMGVRSRPGLYDTFFIPETKLDPRRDAPAKRVAIVSQSGAFIITRMSNLQFLDPRFAVSVGNQIDITVSDMLHTLALRDDIDCIGVYVEGFNDLDGLDFLRAVERATKSGKIIVFYKAGRTSAGRSAAQGHTASVAGDYDICQAAVAAAGGIVTDTFKEFEQLLELATDLHGKRVGGVRLGIISNAGYEAVGMADTIRGARYEVAVAELSGRTQAQLRHAFAEHDLETLVDPGNPLDLTPMATDAAYEDCVRAMLNDDAVDAVIVGCVPMTPKLLTTSEELEQDGSIAHRIARLFQEVDKPLVFVVDCAEPYDALARGVRGSGVPVFRSADQAVRSVGRYLGHRVAYRAATTESPRRNGPNVTNEPSVAYAQELLPEA